MMSMNPIRRSRIILLLILATLAADAAACGTIPPGQEEKNTEARTARVSLASMAIKSPIFLFDGSNRFFKFDLNEKNWTPVSDHGFSDKEPTLSSSVDGRWISYSGPLKDKTTTQYWIYDQRSGTDKLVLEYPVWGAGEPKFSPDGKMLAIALNFDSRQWAGVYLYDTKKLQRWTVQLPIPVTLSVPTAWWSKDGKELLVSISDFSNRAMDKYYSYHLAAKRVEEISGRHDEGGYDATFLRKGREIGTFWGASARSSQYHDSQFSPSGRWNAYLDKEQPDTSYLLNVVDKKGAVKKVALGYHMGCNIDTIAITGWLDDQHLVYRDGSSRFVFDTVTASSAVLFDENEHPPLFTW